jgi:hypothetical protein
VSGRFVAVGVAAALLAAAIAASCYDVPEPDCGFICGPSGACPGGYTCADDHYCHRDGTPAGLVCASADAAQPIDAAVTDAAADAAIDAAPDAPVDAAIDAPDATPAR